MTCTTEIVYMEPDSDNPCEICSDAEGFYATPDDCPDTHYACQCVLVDVEVDADEITYDGLVECVYEEEMSTGEWETDCKSTDTVYQWDMSEDRQEIFDDDCFHDHCEGTSAEWDSAEVDLHEEVSIPANQRFVGEVLGVFKVVEYVANATLHVNDDSIDLGEVTGAVVEFVRLEVQGDLEDCVAGDGGDDGDRIG